MGRGGSAPAPPLLLRRATRACGGAALSNRSREDPAPAAASQQHLFARRSAEFHQFLRTLTLPQLNMPGPARPLWQVSTPAIEQSDNASAK